MSFSVRGLLLPKPIYEAKRGNLSLCFTALSPEMEKKVQSPNMKMHI